MNYILKMCLIIINQDMEQQGKIHHVSKTVVKNITIQIALLSCHTLSFGPIGAFMVVQYV